VALTVKSWPYEVHSRAQVRLNVAFAYRRGFAEQQAPGLMQVLAEIGTKITQVTR
jgi:hypothetical protein